MLGLLKGLFGLPQEPDPTPEEALELGKYYFQAEEYSRALICFTAAARGGLPEAELHLGMMRLQDLGLPADHGEAARHFRIAAEAGNAHAEFNLGQLYAQGLGVDQDLAKAAELYLASAQKGFPQAQWNLSIAYREGRGVERNVALADEWRRKATGT